MGRQLRTLSANEGEKLIPFRSTGATVIHIPNYGKTLIPRATAETYVLDAPTEGCEKTLFSISSTSVAAIVKLSTDGAATVKIGNQLATQITFNATVDMVVQMFGYNSTRWVITSVSPETAAVNSTGVVIGTS